MKSLHLEVGNANLRHSTSRTQHAIKISTDGQRKARPQLTLAEAREWADVFQAGCAALGIEFTTNLPQRNPCAASDP